MPIAAIIADVALAALAGGMLFFAAVVAPRVFIQLPIEVAGPFIRGLFPVYYLYIAIAPRSAQRRSP